MQVNLIVPEKYQNLKNAKAHNHLTKHHHEVFLIRYNHRGNQTLGFSKPERSRLFLFQEKNKSKADSMQRDKNQNLPPN